MTFKHTGVVAIITVSIAIVLAFLRYYNVPGISFLVLQIAVAAVLVALILHFKLKFLWGLAAVILLLAVFIFSLKYKSVQTYIAQKAAKYLSEELKTRVEIGSLYIKPFKSLVLEDLYVQDIEGDTLISSPKFTLDLNFLSLKLRQVSVNTLQMDNGKFYIKQYKDSTTNLEFIVNYFNTGKPDPVKKTRKPFEITFDKIITNNIAFKYKNFNAAPRPENIINFNDLYLSRLNTTILNLNTNNHLAQAEFRNLTFHEKSGFYLKNLSSHVTIDSNRMEFKNLLLETPRSHLSDYVLMTFEDFKAFSHFFNSVYVKAHLNSSRLYPGDIAYFTPAKSVDMDIHLDGDLSGYVNNIKARNFSVKAGKASYFRGDFDIKGLPKISETFLDLNFDQAFSNKQDADFIIKAFTKKDNQIPIIAKKFGNVYFKGRFTGFINDFIAHGEFKTSLGRIVSDINMNIRGKTPLYSGTIKTYDFNLGELLDQKLLGRTTLTTSIKGSGFDIKQINEAISSSISYLDFKGYRYTNIKVDGTFNRNLFNGIVKVNDKNIKLDFNGSANLNPKDPEFNFIASVRSANLNELNLTKDTVQVDADFNTNFTGNNLDNIQGNFELSHIRLTNSKTSLVIDSVQLAAKGIGNNRLLTINSDILDASLKGQYDLETLPAYFKSVAKKYLPSLQLNPGVFDAQNFDLVLKLKYIEPLALLFLPDLKLPEGAVINGKFVSSENIVTVNGFSKLIQYKNIKINDFILDETNNEKALNIFMTSDRVSFNDSLYIQNVNIANIIRNDSLALNIKLSDKDATNQLDLNGLAEFGTDTAVRLSLLPSDVVINHDVWRVQEQVHFKFDKGKTIIENFELFRDDQYVTINGIISADPEDKVNINFRQFKLTTFNPLTKNIGLNMQGELNGAVSISSVTKTPHIEAQMGIDSIILNNTLIGNLKLETDLDNRTRLVNVKMSILKKDEETLNLKGTYDANAEGNSLDMAVTMNNSDLIIFQPFLKRLVSNLQGNVSADLKLRGKLTNPRVNGKLSFNNAGMRVNYLQTDYTITDSIRVEDNVIKLENLILRDSQRIPAMAFVNGTVDMNNIKVPDIDVVIVATSPFMALRTTARNNPAYYGTAYGTGTFSFKGPTNNMYINIDASTTAGTVFNIPLNSSEVISENDFITFVGKDSSLVVKKTNSFKGLTMDFSLNVDESSVVNIYTDLGLLSGRGKAAGLGLHISSFGDFSITGDYLITEGKFVFTAQDFIDRRFDINQGGSIHWAGDPTEAQINLRAIYSRSTNIRPLYSAAGRPPKDKRVEAQAVMILNGPLLKPIPTLELSFPADAYVADELQSYLSDNNNVTLQAFTLIVRGSFAEGNGTANIQDQINSTVRNAATELAFNKFNNILAEALNLKLVDINIRSFSDASASLRLLNERLILTGSVADKRATLNEFSFLDGSYITRDVEAQYLIKKDGSLVLRASNKLNNGDLLNPTATDRDEYVSAFGLAYRQEFDNFKELLQIITGKKRREEKRKREVPPAVLPPPPVVITDKNDISKSGSAP